MFKKHLTIITILTILLTGIPIPLNPATAQEEIERPTKAEKACEEKYPDFNIIYTEAFIDALEEEDLVIDAKYMAEVFEDAQEKYHEYAQCIFDYAEDVVLDSGGVKTRGTTQANAPSFPWFKPDAACISQNKLRDVILDSAPDQLLPPLLENHREYSEFLDKIIPAYQKQGTEKQEDGKAMPAIQFLLTKSQEERELRQRVESEKENALVAIDIAFITLKEMRLAFVMHVHFQCMLNNLEKYRKILEDIRVIAECLPNHLKDASMH